MPCSNDTRPAEPRRLLAKTAMGTVFVVLSLLTSALWLRYRRQSLDMAAGLIAGNIFFALLPMLMAPVIGEIVAEGLPIEPFYYASPSFGLYVLLFSIAIIVADAWSQWIAANWRRPGTTFRSPPERIFSEFYYVFVLAMISLLITFFGSGKLEGAHWAAHAETGIIGAVVRVLAISLRAYVFALAIIALSQRRTATMALMIFFVVADIILTGNRISALYFFVAIICSRAFSYKKIIIVTALLSPGLLLFAVLYPAFRGVVWSQFGGFDGFSEAAGYVWRNGLPTVFDLSNIYVFFEAGNVVIFQYIFETFGHRHAFLDGETVVVKPLTFFIPREIFPEKPLGLGTRLGIDIFGIDGLSLNSLLMGEFYANFGWLAPLLLLVIMSLMLILLRSIHRLQGKQYKLASFILAFSAWRHEFNYIFFGFTMLVLVIIFTTILVRARFRVGHSK